MADIVTSSENLKIENLFVDGDTRTITLKNPKQNISTSDITALNAFCQANNIIVGDRYGGTFARINEVRRVSETKLHLDLGGI